MRTSLEHANRSHELVFEEAVVHLQGEFSGNIDVTLTFDPPVAERDLLASLGLQVPGETALLDVVGYRQTEGTWKLTFCSEHVRETLAVPASIEAYWGSEKEIYLGAIPCRQVAQADIEPVVLAPELAYGKAAVRRSEVKGVLALLGLLLFFLATFYLVFPELREWLRGLFR